MRRLLLLAALAAGVLTSAGEARAFNGKAFGPPATSVTWPGATPPGWYTNTYNHAWYYPWYAYYNFSQGPYANWMAGGGYATYSNFGPGGHFYWYDRVPAQPWVPPQYEGAFRERYPDLLPQEPAAPTAKDDKDDKKPALPLEMPKKMPKEKTNGDTGGRVSIVLPADAKLLFNGTPAVGGGAVRTFQTPPLRPGLTYRYVLTAEVVRDGRTERVSETVTVRAGETTRVTLTPGVVTAGAK